MLFRLCTRTPRSVSVLSGGMEDSSIGEPALNDPTRSSLLALKHTFIVRLELRDEMNIGLHRVIQLQGEKILRIGELLDHQRQDGRTQGDERVELDADRARVRIGADGQCATEP